LVIDSDVIETWKSRAKCVISITLARNVLENNGVTPRKTRKQARQDQNPPEASSLPTVALFQGLPSASLQTLWERSKIQDYTEGHVFFGLGEAGYALFLLEEGRVETFRTSGEKKLIIAELTPPAVFGEMGCVGRCIYHCSAQTTAPSRVRAVSRTDLQNLLEEFPILTRRLLDLVSERFVHVLLDLESTSFKHLIPRLAKLLLEKAEGDYIHNMTHQEIAQHLRVYRESATAALGELKKAGIIEVERKRIRIVHLKRLERAARE
jgi:CRP-like cAMP-binding protein